MVPCEIIFYMWDRLVEASLRRRGRVENWGKPMGKSNWSPVKEVTGVNECGKGEGNEVGEKTDGETSTINGKEESPLNSDEDIIRIAHDLGISMRDGQFRSPISKEAVKLDLAVIPQVVFDNIRHFYLCSLCGKIYWDGSHYERTNSIYADVLGFDLNDSMAKLNVDDQD